MTSITFIDSSMHVCYSWSENERANELLYLHPKEEFKATNHPSLAKILPQILKNIIIFPFPIQFYFGVSLREEQGITMNHNVLKLQCSYTNIPKLFMVKSTERTESNSRQYIRINTCLHKDPHIHQFSSGKENFLIIFFWLKPKTFP